MKLIWGDLTGVRCAGGGGGGAADSCAAGGRQTCNANADCTDYETGFCCHCSSPYIGNGYDCVRPGIQGWAKKPGYRRLITVILSVVNRFKNFFFTGRFRGKFAVKRISKTQPHLAYVATLHCETLMSTKQAINDKLQGSVATYLRCGWVVNNQIKNGLLLSLWVKNLLKSVNIWQSYKQERDCLVHFVRLANTLLKDGESARNYHVLACNFAKYSPI